MPCVIAAGAIIAACGVLPATADSGAWTLESYARRVLDIAPERTAAEAEVAARRAELDQARSWPNPAIEVRADDKLGREDGRGGANFTRVGVSQPLPLRRLSRQRMAAEAVLRGAEASSRSRLLLLEHEAAQVYHALQFAAARLALAQDRLAHGAEFADPTGKRAKRDRLVRYLTPLERQRLVVLREEAQQALMESQREYEKAQTAFRSLLGLAPDAPAAVAAPAPPPAPPVLAELERRLDAHPALTAARQDVESTRAAIAVAAAQRFADPALGLFVERDFLNGARRTVAAVEMAVQIPLWSRNRGMVEKAEADAKKARANLSAAQRDAASRLRQSHAELTRLIEQAERMRANLLDPAREVLDLTRRAFASGESNILALVDANNTYFDAQARYLETIKESALAAASLRLAAGQSVVNTRVAP